MLKQIPYLIAMDMIQPGDFIQVKGTGDISKLIMKFTKYSHSMTIIKYPESLLPHYPNNRLQIVESTIKDHINGLTSSHYIDRLRYDYSNGAEWYWIKTKLNNEQRIRSMEFLIIELAKEIPYDIYTLFRNILGYVPFGTGSYICSELVFAMMIACGAYNGNTQYAPRPGDLDIWLEDIIEDIFYLIGPKDNVC